MRWIMRSLVVMVVCCAAAVAVAGSRSDEKAAVATLEGFFAAFSVEHYPNPDIHQWITEDFLIFEMGEAFDWPRFEAFLENAGYADWISTDWQFSDIRVNVTSDAAHISYVNEGVFVYPDPENTEQRLRESNRWLESVYLIRDGDRFRIQFLQSDNVTREVTVLPADET